MCISISENSKIQADPMHCIGHFKTHSIDGFILGDYMRLSHTNGRNHLNVKSCVASDSVFQNFKKSVLF